MTALPADPPESPCVLVCTMNEATGLCYGCHRTIDEIARWSAMSDAEKRAVLARVKERAAAAPRDSRFDPA